MNYEIIFIVPFIVLIVWVVYKSIQYNREMKNWINHPDWKFTVIEKDELQYVVPNIKGESK